MFCFVYKILRLSFDYTHGHLMFAPHKSLHTYIHSSALHEYRHTFDTFTFPCNLNCKAIESIEFEI